MFDVAFSRRMCCSRVCSVSTKPRSPSRSVVSPTMRPGMRRMNSCLRREEAVVRPPVALVAADRLALADRHVRAVVARAPRAARARARSTCATATPPPAAAAAASSGAGSSTPKTFGCWKITAAASVDAAANRAGSVAPSSWGTSTTSIPNPGAYVFTTWRTCGLTASARTTFVRPVWCLRDVAGVGRHRAAVVAGCVGDVHSRELADRGLVLEDRLQHALAHLGLVRRVRGEELTPREEVSTIAGHVVVVDPHAQERELGVGRALRAASVSRCRISSASPSASGTSSSRAKRTPAGICSKRSSIESTPIAASIALAIAVGLAEVAGRPLSSLRGREHASPTSVSTITVRRRGRCTPRRPAARSPRRDRRVGCARASPRRTGRR